MNTTDLSTVDLAFFSMTAGVAGALFIAITVAMTDRELPSPLGIRGVLAVTLGMMGPMLVVIFDILAFVLSPDGNNWVFTRGFVGAVLLLSMVGLMLVLTLPRRTNQS